MYAYRRALLAPMLALTMTGLASGVAMAKEAPSAESAADSAEGVAYEAADEGGPTALSSADRLSYTTAFDALRRGDLDLARAAAREARDMVLLCQV